MEELWNQLCALNAAAPERFRQVRGPACVLGRLVTLATCVDRSSAACCQHCEPSGQLQRAPRLSMRRVFARCVRAVLCFQGAILVL